MKTLANARICIALFAIVATILNTAPVIGGPIATRSLDIGGLTGTFPFYTDASGITITFNNGLLVDADRQNGLNGVPIFGSVVSGDTPHFAAAARPPGDSVTIDFTAALPVIAPGTIRIHLYDLDSPGGFTERAVITDLHGSTVYFGASGNIPAETALAVPQITEFVTPGPGDIVTIVSDSGDGYYAFSVEWDSIPEPSTLGIVFIGLGLLAIRVRMRTRNPHQSGEFTTIRQHL